MRRVPVGKWHGGLCFLTALLDAVLGLEGGEGRVRRAGSWGRAKHPLGGRRALVSFVVHVRVERFGTPDGTASSWYGLGDCTPARGSAVCRSPHCMEGHGPEGTGTDFIQIRVFREAVGGAVSLVCGGCAARGPRDVVRDHVGNVGWMDLLCCHSNQQSPLLAKALYFSCV